MPAFRRLRGARELSFLPACGRDDDGCDERPIPGDDAFRLMRGWLARPAADSLFAHLKRTTTWVVERRAMYDRVIDVPREQAWCGDGFPRGWPAELVTIRDDIARLARTTFGYVLLNRYRDGNDSVAWHSDRLRVGVPEPVVASLSLGATRAFELRRKGDCERVVSVDLDHGDLVIMTAGAQLRYEHRIPKDSRIGGERLNLTFRQTR